MGKLLSKPWVHVVSKVRAATTPGGSIQLGLAAWDAYHDPETIEVGGMLLSHYLRNIVRLPAARQEEVTARLHRDLAESDRQAPRGSAEAPLQKKRGLVCARKTARVQVLSWNVRDLLPDGRAGGDAAGLLASAWSTDADVIVVGLQDVDRSSGHGMFQRNNLTPRSTEEAFNDIDWPEAVSDWMHVLQEVSAQAACESGALQHVPAGQPVYMSGLLLCVFCRAELVRTQLVQFFFSEVATDSRGLGTTGAVACRFSLHERSFCFLNCNLPSDASFQKQLGHLRQICKSIRFRRNADQIQFPVASHRAVFVCASTNMCLSGTSWKSLGVPRSCQNLDAEQLEELWQHDQLAQHLSQHLPIQQRLFGSGRSTIGVLGHNALQRFTSRAAHETNKPGIEQFDAGTWREPCRSSMSGNLSPSAMKLAPGWPDRILYRSSETEALSYNTVSQDTVLGETITERDPVAAVFVVNCVRLKKGALAELVRDACAAGARHGALWSAPHWRAAEREMAKNVLAAAAPPTQRLAARLFASEPHGLTNERDAAKFVADAQGELWAAACGCVGDRLQAAVVRSCRPGRFDRDRLSLELQGVLAELRELRDRPPAHEEGADAQIVNNANTDTESKLDTESEVQAESESMTESEADSRVGANDQTWSDFASEGEESEESREDVEDLPGHSLMHRPPVIPAAEALNDSNRTTRCDEASRQFLQCFGCMPPLKMALAPLRSAFEPGKAAGRSISAEPFVQVVGRPHESVDERFQPRTPIVIEPCDIARQTY